MANYYASCRTNYFEVKDSEKFLEAMDNIPGIVVDTDDGHLFYILGDDPDGAGWPAWGYDEEMGNEYEIDLPVIVSEHLADDSVAIFMEVGSEKLRFIIGWALAVNNKGETRLINLSDIYDIAKAELTNKPDRVTVAEY